MHPMNTVYGEKAWRQLRKNAANCTVINHLSRKPSKLDEQNMQDTAREVKTNSSVMNSCGPLHMDAQSLDDQL